VKGILFLATPHQGSESTKFPSILTNIANIALSGTSRKFGRMRSDLIEAIETKSEVLREISVNFRHKAGNFQVASFVEQDTILPLRARVCIISVLKIPPT